MNRLKFLLVLFFLALASCDSGDTQTFNAYPLAVGNRWEYTVVFEGENFRSINGSSYELFTINETHIVEITQKTRLKTAQDVYELKSTILFPSFGTAINGYSYQNQTADELFSYAYINPSSSLPRASGVRYAFKGMTFNSVEEMFDVFENGFQQTANRGDDSLFYENPPVKSLHFPYQRNFKWVVRESEPFRIEKEHLDLAPITTPVGNQNCVKTRWYWDLNRDGISDSNMEGYDYWNQNGLIKREFLFKDVLVRDEKNDTVGLIDIRETYLINSFSIR